MIQALSVSVADNSSLELMGTHFMTFYTDLGYKSEQPVYFDNNVGEFYLSKAALTDLQDIGKNFPQVGSCPKGKLYEVNDEFSSARLLNQSDAHVQYQYQNDAPIHKQPGQRQVVPAPKCPPDLLQQRPPLYPGYSMVLLHAQ